MEDFIELGMEGADKSELPLSHSESTLTNAQAKSLISISIKCRTNICELKPTIREKYETDVEEDVALQVLQVQNQRTNQRRECRKTKTPWVLPLHNPLPNIHMYPTVATNLI